MNFKDFLVVLLSLLLFSVSPSQAEKAPPLNDKQKHDEIKARQRIIDIDLKKELEAEQVVSHEYYAETSAGNVILLNSTEYVTQDYSGNIKILGELQNVGNSDVCFVKITYTFRDASNALLDTEFTYVYGSSKRWSSVVTDTVLSPDEVGSFELYTNVPYNLVSSMYYTII